MIKFLLFISLTFQVKSYGDYRSSGMTPQMRQSILDAHNQKRQIVASGQQVTMDGTTFFPQASNMKVMNYNMNLETLAMNWAKTCPSGHNPDRTIDGINDYIGENLYFSWTPHVPVINDTDMDVPVDEWYNEVEDCPVSEVSSYQRVSGAVIGHFTQVIWAETTQFGCAVSHCYDTSEPQYPNVITVVCNYSPGGNWIGNPVYQAGNQCSSTECNCNNQYNALCGIITSLSTGNTSTQIQFSQISTQSSSTNNTQNNTTQSNANISKTTISNTTTQSNSTQDNSTNSNTENNQSINTQNSTIVTSTNNTSNSNTSSSVNSQATSSDSQTSSISVNSSNSGAQGDIQINNNQTNGTLPSVNSKGWLFGGILSLTLVIIH